VNDSFSSNTTALQPITVAPPKVGRVKLFGIYNNISTPNFKDSALNDLHTPMLSDDVSGMIVKRIRTATRMNSDGASLDDLSSSVSYGAGPLS